MISKTSFEEPTMKVIPLKQSVHKWPRRTSTNVTSETVTALGIGHQPSLSENMRSSARCIAGTRRADKLDSHRNLGSRGNPFIGNPRAGIS